MFRGYLDMKECTDPLFKARSAGLDITRDMIQSSSNCKSVS